jgi:phosphoribosylamine--glycine ligase
MASDILDVMLAVTEGRLGECPIEWRPEACVGTVLASAGYPGSFRKGYPIYGLQDVPPEVIVFHAGTRLYHNEISGRTQVVSDGGRVLTMVALGAALEEARGKVYNSLRRIRFEGMYYRKDVAAVSATKA